LNFNPVCVECKAVMRKARLGIAVYRKRKNYIKYIVIGDRFVCPRCEKEIINDFGKPFTFNEQKAMRDIIQNRESLRIVLE